AMVARWHATGVLWRPLNREFQGLRDVGGRRHTASGHHRHAAGSRPLVVPGRTTAGVRQLVGRAGRHDSEYDHSDTRCWNGPDRAAPGIGGILLAAVVAGWPPHRGALAGLPAPGRLRHGEQDLDGSHAPRGILRVAVLVSRQ